MFPIHVENLLVRWVLDSMDIPFGGFHDLDPPVSPC